MDDKEAFKRVKEEAEKNYKTIGEISCPYLKEKVSFNAKGLDHIKFNSWDKARTMTQQFLRLKFLKLAPQVIIDSHTLQELHTRRNFERRQRNSRWEKIMMDVKYYGFVAIIKNVRIKIIVKEIKGGKPFFWSIIPYWKTKNDPIVGEIKKVFCEGDMETQ